MIVMCFGMKIRLTTNPRMTTPIANRSQTTVIGVTYPKATLVATKDAPQAVTENRALRTALRCELAMLF